ncbi:MAG: chromosomal replication initiator protein DnaA [Planctomycetota bacterium]
MVGRTAFCPSQDVNSLTNSVVIRLLHGLVVPFSGEELAVTVCAQNPVQEIQSRIAEMVGPQRFNVWFKNATRFTFTEDYLRVSTPNHFIGEWIENHFSDVITQAAREVTGDSYTLSFAIDPMLAKGLGKKQPDRQVAFVANNPERLAREKRKAPAIQDVPALRGRIDNFVVGPSNRLAYSAAQHVIEHPANEYNPLFIHGGCGLGKTHLLQAICNGLSEKRETFRWRYVSGEEFTNDYVYAVKAREQDAFRKRYRDIDALIIDDVHFLANKRATQAEFLQTLKAVDDKGTQIVLSSDAHPKMIGHFSDALVSRFVQGMVVRIDSPDVGVRAEVLRRRAHRLKVEIPEAVINYIAENFRANIRELEGALLKVVAHAQVVGQPVTLPLAERAIKDLVRQTAPVVMLSDIESIVAIYFGLTPADLHTSRKSRNIALARGIAMYLARKHTDMSYPEIGRFMGNKNHSTVILAARRISKMLQENENVRWLTPAGQKEQNLAVIISEIEEQFGSGRGLKSMQEASSTVIDQPDSNPDG